MKFHQQVVGSACDFSSHNFQKAFRFIIKGFSEQDDLRIERKSRHYSGEIVSTILARSPSRREILDKSGR